MSVAATLMYFAESEVIVGLDTHTHTQRKRELLVCNPWAHKDIAEKISLTHTEN